RRHTSFSRDWSSDVCSSDLTHGDALDHALVAAGLDVFADAEGVVREIEDARDDIAHQCLRAEAEGEAEDSGAGENGADVDADVRSEERRVGKGGRCAGRGE